MAKQQQIYSWTVIDFVSLDENNVHNVIIVLYKYRFFKIYYCQNITARENNDLSQN